MALIAQISLAHKRTGTIYLENHLLCDICRIVKTCLTIDGSEDEYGEITICKDCIDDAFKRS